MNEAKVYFAGLPATSIESGEEDVTVLAQAAPLTASFSLHANFHPHPIHNRLLYHLKLTAFNSVNNKVVTVSNMDLVNTQISIQDGSLVVSNSTLTNSFFHLNASKKSESVNIHKSSFSISMNWKQPFSIVQMVGQGISMNVSHSKFLQSDAFSLSFQGNMIADLTVSNSKFDQMLGGIWCEIDKLTNFQIASSSFSHVFNVLHLDATSIGRVIIKDSNITDSKPTAKENSGEVTTQLSRSIISIFHAVQVSIERSIFPDIVHSSPSYRLVTIVCFVHFLNNSVNRLLNVNESELDIQSNYFEGNRGGCIFATNSSVDINKSSFSRNYKGWNDRSLIVKQNLTDWAEVTLNGSHGGVLLGFACNISVGSPISHQILLNLVQCFLLVRVQWWKLVSLNSPSTMLHSRMIQHYFWKPQEKLVTTQVDMEEFFFFVMTAF